MAVRANKSDISSAGTIGHATSMGAGVSSAAKSSLVSSTPSKNSSHASLSLAPPAPSLNVSAIASTSSLAALAAASSVPSATFSASVATANATSTNPMTASSIIPASQPFAFSAVAKQSGSLASSDGNSVMHQFSAFAATLANNNVNSLQSAAANHTAMPNATLSTASAVVQQSAANADASLLSTAAGVGTAATPSNSRQTTNPATLANSSSSASSSVAAAAAISVTTAASAASTTANDHLSQSASVTTSAGVASQSQSNNMSQLHSVNAAASANSSASVTSSAATSVTLPAPAAHTVPLALAKNAQHQINGPTAAASASVTNPTTNALHDPAMSTLKSIAQEAIKRASTNDQQLLQPPQHLESVEQNSVMASADAVRTHALQQNQQQHQLQHQQQHNQHQLQFSGGNDLIGSGNNGNSAATTATSLTNNTNNNTVMSNGPTSMSGGIAAHAVSNNNKPATNEAHIPPLLGVAPLGTTPLQKEQQLQFQMMEASYYHLPAPNDSERLRPYMHRQPVQTPAHYPQVFVCVSVQFCRAKKTTECSVGYR